MMLLTKANRKALPALGSTDGDDAAKSVVSFFTPGGSWTWYALEFDGVDTFFGYAVDDTAPWFGELGHFSLAELKSVKGLFGLGIERDRYHTPKTIDEIRAKHGGS